jgi:hypothetical protein
VWVKPTNTLRLHNLTIAKQQAVWRLEQTGKAFARATNLNKQGKPLREQQKKIHFIFHSQRNALTMFLAFLFIMTVACFNKLSLNTQTAWLFAPDKLLYLKIFMGAAQTRNF